MKFGSHTDSVGVVDSVLVLYVDILASHASPRLSMNTTVLVTLVLHYALLEQSVFDVALHLVEVREDLLLALGAALVDLDDQLDIVVIPVAHLVEPEQV